MIGSFFVELNELPKTLNTRVKGSMHQRFQCHEAYYTLFDSKNEKVSRDRLGLKLYLLENGTYSFFFGLTLFLDRS